MYEEGRSGARQRAVGGSVAVWRVRRGRDSHTRVEVGVAEGVPVVVVAGCTPLFRGLGFRVRCGGWGLIDVDGGGSVS